MYEQNMLTKYGNPSRDQKVIENATGLTFKSYDSIICYYSQSEKQLYLNGRMWDYSATTRKYFKDFVNFYTCFDYASKQKWEREIEKNNKIFYQN